MAPRRSARARFRWIVGPFLCAILVASVSVRDLRSNRILTGFVTPTDASNADIVVDAVFGFSFNGWRGEGKDAPFDTIVSEFAKISVPIVSIDIPSGWHVEKGPEQSQFRPEMLVSLTAPKLGVMSESFRHHYLGGRFVPPALSTQYNLILPEFPGSEQAVKIN
eukprot:GEMP01078678.1.p1 GENE.GEMP01078678.1~~GEMP01078678.1.p1  ORF type:complete len:164 (+),score=42.33 GEMP01078678.1:417-908(+)